MNAGKVLAPSKYERKRYRRSNLSFSSLFKCERDIMTACTQQGLSLDNASFVMVQSVFASPMGFMLHSLLPFREWLLFVNLERGKKALWLETQERGQLGCRGCSLGN